MTEPKISTESITPKSSSYKKWVESEGIPLVESFFVDDIAQVPLAPWKRTGGLGVRFVWPAPARPTTPISARFLPVNPWRRKNICTRS